MSRHLETAIITSSVSRNAGGLFESVRRLGQELNSCFVSVDVFSCWDQYVEQDIPAWFPLQPKTFHTSGPRIFAYAPGFLSALKAKSYDIIHCHGIWMYPSVAHLIHYLEHKTPYLISPHGMLDPWAVNNSRLKKVIAGMLYENRHLRSAASIRSLCAAETSAIRSYGLTNPVCQIPNGIDIVERTSYVSPPWAGRVEDGRKVLLYLGRIHPKKGLINLINGWSQINGHKEWVLAIAGWDQGGHEADLKKLVDELGCSSKIIFLGPQFNENKESAYHHAAAFILPSFSEGLPMVVLEAWAYGLPVLMTSFCNLPEGFESDAALQIDPEPVSIADGLRQLFSMTSTERTEMGKRGYALVCQRFTWQIVAKDLRDVYDWILGGGTPPESVIFR